MNRFLPAILMRVLPALQPPAFFSDAGESVRKAWAAMSASVTGCLPTELPVPRLPSLTMPSFRLPHRPTISPPLGRFFSSLSTLMFAPGQIHGMAIYYQVATGDMVDAHAAGPRVECVDVAVVPWAGGAKARFEAGLTAPATMQAAVAVGCGAHDWQPAGTSASIEFVWTAALITPAGRSDGSGETARPGDLDRENWVDLAAQGTRVRGQRPPPRGADFSA